MAGRVDYTPAREGPPGGAGDAAKDAQREIADLKKALQNADKKAKESDQAAQAKIAACNREVASSRATIAALVEAVKQLQEHAAKSAPAGTKIQWKKV